MSRPRVQWWAPKRTGWWVAVLFMVGSACFALGALPPYVDRVGPRGAGITFFVGSLFFTSAAALQLLLSTGAVPSVGYHPAAAVQWRALRRAPDRAEWRAGVVQLAGTLLFNVSTFAALNQALTATQENRRVWTPDVFGSMDTLRDAQRANVATFVGALCFLAGALLLIPDQADPPPTTSSGRRRPREAA